jgi:hypothetical protein
MAEKKKKPAAKKKPPAEKRPKPPASRVSRVRSPARGGRGR